MSWVGKSRARAKGIQPNGTKKETQKTSPPPHDPSRTCSECCLCKGDVVGGDFFAVPCGHGPFCGCCRRHLEEDGRGLRICQLCRQSDASSEQMLISDWVLAEALQGQCPRQDNKNKTSGRFRHPFGPRRPPEMVREAEERLQTLPPRWEEEDWKSYLSCILCSLFQLSWQARYRLLLVLSLSLLAAALCFTGPREPGRKLPKATMQGLKFDVPGLAAPKRRSRKQKQEEEEEEQRQQEEDEEARNEQLRKDILAEQEEEVHTPHLYPEVHAFKRLMRQELGPGHLVLRKWLKKGKSQGFVTVPFSSALGPVVADPSVNICIVSRRERSDKRIKGWQEKLEELPLFDVSGVVETPVDIDPLEPAWETPLDQIPNHQEVQKQLEDKKVVNKMLTNSLRSEDEIQERATSEAGEAKVLRELTQQLPARLLTEEYRELIRKTVVEVLMVMWSMHASTGSTKLRWRLACTDQQEAPSPETSLRSIFLLAGEPLEFIPKQFVDRAKFSAEQLLSDEQIRRMDSEAWAGSLTKKGINASEAFKQVPPGWMTVLKGDSWPDMKGKGAVYRLPQFGKRLYVEVDLLEAPTIPAANVEASEQVEQEYRPSFLQSLGPLAGLAALILGLAQKTFIFKAGQARRMELEQTLRALQRRPEETLEEETARLKGFEQKLWTDLEPDEAPVVLVVGSETETGQVVLRKLITSGYPCVELKSGTADEALGKKAKESTNFVTVTLTALA
eukprot:symbB.v1.2.003915.t1/scaffold210.1/size302740/6